MLGYLIKYGGFMSNAIINELKIEEMIYEIRGKQVMLDSDLAKLYRVETKRINEAVKNNPLKFPERFSWKLSDLESQTFLVENFDQKNVETRGGKFKNPRVFTEQGVAMLATILKSSIATQISIGIMDAFVSMRKYISSSLLEQTYINELVLKDSKRIDVLEETFSKFKEKTNEIYFDGQIYDAYSKIIEIMDMAKSELIIIDAYADKSVLDIISKINCKVILICKKKTLLKEIDIEKYNSQYHNLTIFYNDRFHDRYFLLDRKALYHSGTSLNHIGEKTFSINKIEDHLIVIKLMEEIEKMLS